MKFTNGLWLIKDNFDINSPAQVYDYRISDDNKKATIFVPYKAVNNRDQTTDVGATTIDVTSPLKNVLGIKLTHFDQFPKQPSFHINDQHVPMNADIKENDHFTVKSGDLAVTIPLGKQPFKMQFRGNGKLLTSSEPGMQGEITDRKSGKHYMREALDLDVSEYVYGLGERFTHFVKNGQTVDTVNKDGGTGSEQTYKNIPFYLTNRGYGVFVDQPETVSFEVASEYNDKVQFSVEGQSIQYYVIYGPTPKDNLVNYTYLTGKPALTPAW